MDKKKYYIAKVPEKRNIKNWGLDKVDDMPEFAEGNSIPVQVEDRAVIQRLSRDIYANPQSGVREIYANEIKACKDTLEMDPNANPEIVFTVNSLYRQITLEGIDSKGMSWDTFKNVYCVLGRTTNNNGKLPGQFGFGRAAYMVLSDDMSLQTHSRETGEKYTILGSSGTEFITGDAPPKMEHFGTRIDITPRNDVDLEDLIDMVKSCARLSGIKTTIIADGEFERHSGVVEEQSLEDMAVHHDNDWTDLFKKNSVITIKDKDIDVSFNVGSGTHYNTDTAAFLCGMPIEYKYNGVFDHHVRYDKRIRIAINIKDERKFEPTPDRERLSEKAANQVTEKIDHMIKNKLVELGSKQMSFQEYVENNDARLIDFLYKTGLKEFGVIPFVEQLNSNAGLLMVFGKVGDDEHAVALGNCLNKDTKFVIARRQNPNHTNAVKLHDPTVKVITLRNYKDNSENLLKAGIMTVQDYLKANNISVRKLKLAKKVNIYRVKSNTEAYSPCNTPVKTCMSDKIPNNVVIVNKEQEMAVWKIKEEIDRRAKESSDVRFLYVRESAVGSNYSGGRTFSEWMDIVNNTKVDTDQGKMSLKKVFETGKRVAIHYILDENGDPWKPVLKDDVISIAPPSHKIERRLAFYLNFQGKDKHQLSADFLDSMKLQVVDLDESELGGYVISKYELESKVSYEDYRLFKAFKSLKLQSSVDLLNNISGINAKFNGSYLRTDNSAILIRKLEQELLSRYDIDTTRNGPNVTKVRVCEIDDDVAYTVHPANNIPNDAVIIDDKQLIWIEEFDEKIKKGNLPAFRYVEKSTLGDDYSGGMTFSEWMKVVNNTICETSDGIMTLKQVFETGKKVVQFSGKENPVWNTHLKDGIICIKTPDYVNRMFLFHIWFDKDGNTDRNGKKWSIFSIKHIAKHKLNGEIVRIHDQGTHITDGIIRSINGFEDFKLEGVGKYVDEIKNELPLNINTDQIHNFFTAMEQDMIKTYNIDTKTTGV